MRAIAACAVATLLTGCAMSPAEIRRSEPVARGLLKGDEKTVARCVSDYVATRFMPFSLTYMHAVADDLGLRVMGGTPPITLMMFELAQASGATTAAVRVAGGHLEGVARDTLEACKA